MRNKNLGIEIVPLDWQTVDAVHAIREEAYPPYISNPWKKIDMLGADFILSGILDLSFLSRDKKGKFTGYCIAFLAESEIDLQTENPSIHVADMAVSPDARGSHMVHVLGREILARAKRFDIERIEFHARENTMYSALMNSSHTQQIFTEYGYELGEYEPADKLEWRDGSGALIERGRLMSAKSIAHP